jgi:hypothetical protein
VEDWSDDITLILSMSTISASFRKGEVDYQLYGASFNEVLL